MNGGIIECRKIYGLSHTVELLKRVEKCALVARGHHLLLDKATHSFVGGVNCTITCHMRLWVRNG
jgi:hypothetical protein